MAFRLNIPKEVPTTFQSPFLRVDHALEATAVVAFGRDISLRVPALVFRGENKKRTRSAKTIPPLVGHERHLAVWQAAVAQVRLPAGADIRFDAESQTATLHVGEISLQVREEQRSDVGPCLVASLEYAPLGLGLRVAERSWTEFGAKLPSLDKRFQKRFTVQIREEAQAAHLLNPHVQHALSSFDEVGLDDEGAVLMRKGGVHQLAGLQRFLQIAYQLAHTLWNALQDIPPPQVLAPSFKAYERFAQRKGVKVRRGDCSLPHWLIRGVPLMLDHRWDGTMPLETRLWTPKPQQGDMGPWKQALESLAKSTLLQEEERLGLMLPLVKDPEEINDLSDQFAAAVGRLLGAKAGPYR